MKTEIVNGKAFFSNINKVPKQFQYLTEDIECEVIIIGGGATGAIVGNYFAKNNVDTVIIEKARVGYGSTSITTALLQYELDSNAMELKSALGLENVIKAYKLGQYALDEIEKFINENGNNCSYRKRDCFLYTDKKLEVKELIEEYEIRKENGLEVELVTEENNPFSFNLKAGIYSKNGGAELDPYRFTYEMIKNGEMNGLRVFENTEAKNINYYDNEVEVITSYGKKITAKKVIIATGYDIDKFTSINFGNTTNTFNIVTEPVEKIEGWENNALIRDNNNPYHYFRTTDDNRLIAGGEDINFKLDYTENEFEEIYKKLENKLIEMFPKIDNIKIQYKYCGVFKETYDNLGFFGEGNKKNEWYCLGYGANGILFAVLGGIYLTNLFLGKNNDVLELFNIKRVIK